MIKVRIAVVAALALALVTQAGCVLSLQPFYTKESIVAPIKLAGKWRRLDRDGNTDNGDIWAFDGERVVAYDDRGRWRAFKVTWFRVDGQLYADTYPDELQNEPSTSEAYWFFHHLPFHMVSRVEDAGDRLLVTPLTYSGFNEVTADAPVADWTVEVQEQTAVLNATPANWTDFLKRYGHDPKVFVKDWQITFVPMEE